jgi:predicted alpha/beta superfamily hydrolase
MDRGKMRIFLLLLVSSLVLVLVIAPEPASSGGFDTRHLQSLGQVDYIAFTPERPNRDFHVFVDLPEDYQASGENYPTVYLLDGGNTYPLLAAYHHYLRFGDEAPRVIRVGISYGADSFREGNMRQTDFTAPSPERDFWGGGEAFLDAVEKELIPLIEQRYRADPDQRILFGHSLGGQLVLLAAMRRPGLFHGLMASNPAIVGNLDYFLDATNLSTSPGERTRLFLALAEHERAELRGNTLAWKDHWQAAQRPWEMEFMILPGQTHLSSVAESFRQGLRWLLPAAVVDDSETPPLQAADLECPNAPEPEPQPQPPPPGARLISSLTFGSKSRLT